MKLNLRVSKRATEDLVEMAAHIAQDNWAVADRLILAAEMRYADLAEMPGIGSLCDDWLPYSKGVRRMILPRFPKHLVYYEVIGEELRILRFVHGMRDVPRVLDGMLEEGREGLL